VYTLLPEPLSSAHGAVHHRRHRPRADPGHRRHRLQPGTKLAEQKLADHFGVSRTLVRQALFQLAQNRLVRLEPARGAFVAAPTVEEARQVFAVRRMLEAEMARAFVPRSVTPAKHPALREHVAREKAALTGDTTESIDLLGDFHVRMAELMGNDVLAQILRDLISRSSLITLMYQRAGAAEHSQEEHVEIVRPWPRATATAPPT
jgi:DNA-binding GntR family transcriptional regulator